jgi:hypothetical protein
MLNMLNIRSESGWNFDGKANTEVRVSGIITPMEARVREAARIFYRSTTAFQAGDITADECRAQNRAARAGLSDYHWNVAKARALSVIAANA